MKNILLYAVAFGSLLAACQKSSRFEPARPDESYADTAACPSDLISTVNVPVEVPLAEIGKQINSQVGQLIYEDNSLEDNGHDELLLKIWKREPIRVEAAGGGFRLTVPLRVWARKGFAVLGSTHYQETEFSLDTRFLTRLAVGADWQAASTTLADGYEWREKPYLRLGIVELPITPLVNRVLAQQQQAIATRMDAHLKGQLNLRPHIERVWREVQQPVQVSAAHNAWLRVTPLGIWVTPVAVSGTSARLTVGIRARTETLIGRQPAPVEVSAVPPLQDSPQGTPPDDFQVGISSEIPHSVATRMAAAELVGKTFSFAKGRHITITSIDLYGNNGLLVVRTGVSGSLAGTLYLAGKPYFNPANQSVELQGLDFVLDTKSRLLRTADWLAHGTLARRMQEKLKLPVGPQLEATRQSIRTQLANRQLARGIALNGTLDEFSPGEVRITPQAIVAVITARGRLNVKVSGW